MDNIYSVRRLLLLLLVIGLLISFGGVVYAQSYPHEQCTDWIYIGTDTADITVNGCYRIVVDNAKVIIDQISSNGNVDFVVVDYNGHTADAVFTQPAFKGVLEIENAISPNIYIYAGYDNTDSNLYLYNIKDMQVEVIAQGNSSGLSYGLYIGKSSGSVKYDIRYYDQNFYFYIEDSNITELRATTPVQGNLHLTAINTSIDRLLLGAPNMKSWIDFNNVSLTHDTDIVTNVQSVSVSNSKLDDRDLLLNPTSTSDQNGAYLFTADQLPQEPISAYFLGVLVSDYYTPDIYCDHCTYLMTPLTSNLHSSNVDNLILLSSGRGVWLHDSNVRTYGGGHLEIYEMTNSNVDASSSSKVWLSGTVTSSSLTAQTADIANGVNLDFNRLVLSNGFSSTSFSGVDRNIYLKADYFEIQVPDITIDLVNNPIIHDTVIATGGNWTINYQMDPPDGRYVVFRNVDVNSGQIHITCNQPNTRIIFEGTTDPSDFDVDSSNCVVTDNSLKPNLTVTSDQTYAEVPEGTPVEYNVTVTSYDRSVDNVLVRVYVYDPFTRNTQTFDRNIPHIDANQSVTVTFDLNLTSSPFTYSIYAKVDPDNTIAESNENDNDNRSNRFYVNVVRYVDSCTDMYTGQYKLTRTLGSSDLNRQPCFHVLSGETVSFRAGTGIIADSQFFTVLQNDGTLYLNGMWGKGRIASYGTTYMYYVTKGHSDGFQLMVGSGTTYLNRNVELRGITFINGGTVYLNGPNVSVGDIYMYDFTGSGSIHIYSSPENNVTINGMITGYQTKPLYTNTTVSDPDGVYIYTDVTPDFAPGVTSVAGIILGPGMDANFEGITLGSLELSSKLNDPSIVYIRDSNIDGYLLSAPDQANHVNNTGVYNEIHLDNTKVNVQLSDIENTNLYIDGKPVEISLLRNFTDNTYYLHSTTFRVNTFMLLADANTVTMSVDLTDSPSTVDIDTVDNSSGGKIVFECTGKDWLYLSDSLLDSNDVDLSACLWNVDYNRNVYLTLDTNSITVYPDRDYEVTVTVHSDADYTDVNVPVTLYIDGVPVKTEYVTVSPHGSATLTFTAHSTPEAGGQDLTFVADANNEIPEANENDNSVSLHVNVVQPPAAPKTTTLGGAAGGGGVTATKTVYVSAELGKESKAVIHIFWKYPYKTTAYLVYYSINGTVSGPNTVTLKPGDNMIQILVKPMKYGKVGEVVVKAQNYKDEIAIYARPLASLYPVSERYVKAITLALLFMGALVLIAKIFGH